MVVEILKGICTIVRVDGERDLSNLKQMETVLDEAASESPRGFVIDASQVSYIDGGAIKAILAVWARARENGGGLAIVANDMVGLILDTLGAKGLPGLFVSDTVQDAVDTLCQR